ncbi:hypothetical protein, partial [Ileibacterium valens]|uniref:hypothetical protein n=1 Tax=Ileibacterium valens TaxID=1862668 RepID=UPI002572BA3B
NLTTVTGGFNPVKYKELTIYYYLRSFFFLIHLSLLDFLREEIQRKRSKIRETGLYMQPSVQSSVFERIRADPCESLICFF